MDKSLKEVHQPDGSVFHTDQAREKFITDYYSEIYKKRVGENIAIEDFLGNEVLANPVVAESHLKDNEILLLERPLQINELDKAIKEAKTNAQSPPYIGENYQIPSKRQVYV